MLTLEMALETAFRRFALLPNFMQAGNGEPRKAHWLGNKQPATPQQDQNQGGNEDRPQKRSATRVYRDLSSITLGEVEDVYNHFKNQLVSSPAPGWIAKNSFCQVPLKRRGEERPSVVFGRVKTLYPSDGYVDNIEEMEMYFPNRDGTPDVINIRHYDIALQRPAQSYCVGVKLYVSPEEMTDFARSENIFLEKGFAPIYENGYLDLLDLNEQNYAAAHWLYVIGSAWLASIPHTLQLEVREQLRNLVRWEKTVFNYHPRRYSLQYPTLNEELDFQYGFTEHYLVAPQDTDQALKKVEERFGQIFMQAMA